MVIHLRTMFHLPVHGSDQHLSIIDICILIFGTNTETSREINLDLSVDHQSVYQVHVFIFISSTGILISQQESTWSLSNNK